MIRVSLPRPPRIDTCPRRARINNCPAGWWYADRVGQVIEIEFIDHDGYWAREGGTYNCINKIRPEDATMVGARN